MFLIFLAQSFYSFYLFYCDITCVLINNVLIALILAGLPELLMHKNRLQEYTQRSAIPLPIYQTFNEGFQHAPKFRSAVLVDGETYKSPNSFSHRKAAEQDVARIALESISKKIKDEGCPLIREVCCMHY